MNLASDLHEKVNAVAVNAAAKNDLTQSELVHSWIDAKGPGINGMRDFSNAVVDTFLKA